MWALLSSVVRWMKVTPCSAVRVERAVCGVRGASLSPSGYSLPLDSAGSIRFGLMTFVYVHTDRTLHFCARWRPTWGCLQLRRGLRLARESSCQLH